MIKKYERFTVKFKQKNSLFLLKKIIPNIIQELDLFFVIKPCPHIELIDSPEEFAFYKGYHYNWMVGTAIKQNVWIFNPEKIEKYTIHKKNCFKTVLKHELTHVYINTISPFIPTWLNEGVATFQSQSFNKKRFSLKDLNEFFSPTTNQDKINLKNYVMAPLFVKHLIETKRKKTFLKFLKNYKTNETRIKKEFTKWIKTIKNDTANTKHGFRRVITSLE